MFSGMGMATDKGESTIVDLEEEFEEDRVGFFDFHEYLYDFIGVIF